MGTTGETNHGSVVLALSTVWGISKPLSRKRLEFIAVRNDVSDCESIDLLISWAITIICNTFLEALV